MSAALAPWTLRTTPFTSCRQFAQNGARLVSESGIYSDNAATWLDGTTGRAVTFDSASIAFGNGVFVAVGENSNNDFLTAAYSANGASWTMATVSLAFDTRQLLAVVYLTSVGFVAFADDSQSEVAISGAGSSWSVSSTSGLPNGVRNVVVGGVRLVGVAGDGLSLVTSTNGTAWSSCTLPSFDGTPIIAAAQTGNAAGAYADDRFVFLFTDDTGSGVLTSTTGLTFTMTRFTGALAATVCDDSSVVAWDTSHNVLVVQTPFPSPIAYVSEDFTTFTATNSPVRGFATTWYASGQKFVAGASTGGTQAVETSSVTGVATTMAGFDALEGEAVSIAVGGIVVASPYNPAYPVIIVTGGEITFTIPDGATGNLVVGLPFVTDIQTLDIDTAGGTMKPQKFLITNVGAYLEDSMAFFAGPEEPTTSTGLTLPSGGSMQQLQVLDSNENASTTPQTGFRSVNFEGRWNESGTVFIRNVDPSPLTVLALVPYGTYPPR